MEWLFRLLEWPLVWLSQRPGRHAPKTEEHPRDGLGTADGNEAFSFRSSDLARHLYILGSTGCGKTTLILQLIEADLRAGRTIVVLDLRGDLVRHVLSLCEELGIDPEQVTLLDLREKDRIQGFNPLSGAGEPYIRALHLLEVVRDEAESWGVQLEETLRAALLLLAAANEPVTRLEAVFFDAMFRTRAMQALRDPAALGFWQRYASLSPERQQAWALPVLNKVTALLAVPTLRHVLGNSDGLKLDSTLSQAGRIVLVSVAVDELHRSGRMLGSLIVSAIAREMMARVNVPESRRNPVRLYVDEFENMASESFEGLIAEGRRFGLTLVLSHQTLAQLPARLRSVVRNNVGVQILFQTGFEDAKLLSRELPSEITIEDLRALEVGQAIVMFRDGTYHTVQFKAPRRARAARLTDAYRSQVLSRLPEAPEEDGVQASPEPSTTPPVSPRSACLEDLL